MSKTFREIVVILAIVFAVLGWFLFSMWSGQTELAQEYAEEIPAGELR